MQPQNKEKVMVGAKKRVNKKGRHTMAAFLCYN
jgi:hypothetical protein